MTEKLNEKVTAHCVGCIRRTMLAAWQLAIDVDVEMVEGRCGSEEARVSMDLLLHVLRQSLRANGWFPPDDCSDGEFEAWMAECFEAIDELVG